VSARHRKPTLATVIRVTGAVAVAFQLSGLTLVIIGGWNATEGAITNLGVFCLTLSALAVVAHVVYRRTPAVLAKRAAELVAETTPTDTMRTSELPTIPGLTIGRDPNVTTIKVTPRKHRQPEPKK
jgi:hypothetical protein